MAAVSTQLRTSGGGMSAPGSSRLSMMQARFREQLMVEKESRLLEMAAKQEADREGTIQRVTRSSATSLSSSLSSLSLSSSGAGQGRVRKMFEDRRSQKASPVGWDKSYPLDPVARNNRPPVKGVVRNKSNAGPPSGAKMPQRSRSQVPLQRTNRQQQQQQQQPSRTPLRSRGAHHKSTSSLLDTNQNYNGHARSREPSPPSPSYRGYQRGPSPVPVQSSYRGGPSPIPPLRTAKGRKSLGNLRTSKSQEDYSSYNTLAPSPPQSKPSPAKARLHVNNHVNHLNNNDINSLPLPKQKLAPKSPARTKGLSLPSSRVSSGRSGAATPRSRVVPDGLEQCPICERNFNPDRIEKHKTICAKSKAKAEKRKVFDATKMRTKGTESEKYISKGAHLKEVKPKKADWRKQHQDFIATVRAAKGVKGYEAPPLDTSDYVECPHCGRKFNESVAERHIPKCASIQSNKPAGGHSNKGGFGRRR